MSVGVSVGVVFGLNECNVSCRQRIIPTGQRCLSGTCEMGAEKSHYLSSIRYKLKLGVLYFRDAKDVDASDSRER